MERGWLGTGEAAAARARTGSAFERASLLHICHERFASHVYGPAVVTVVRAGRVIDSSWSNLEASASSPRITMILSSLAKRFEPSSLNPTRVEANSSNFGSLNVGPILLLLLLLSARLLARFESLRPSRTLKCTHRFLSFIKPASESGISVPLHCQFFGLSRDETSQRCFKMLDHFPTSVSLLIRGTPIIKLNVKEK